MLKISLGTLVFRLYIKVVSAANVAGGIGEIQIVLLWKVLRLGVKGVGGPGFAH